MTDGAGGIIASGAIDPSMYAYHGIHIETQGERELRQRFADFKQRAADREEELEMKIELVKLGWVGTINNLHPPEPTKPKPPKRFSFFKWLFNI